jgi:dihydrodipicolinate synthase/N-acetylneuraminate lyase
MTPFQQKIRGSIPALLTALHEDHTVDGPSLTKVARRAIDNGSKGVVVLGTTGEFAGIDDDQRETAITAIVNEIGADAPVIVGCGQPNVRRTHEQARAAADLGADGILVNPPFYFPMTQDEIVGFFGGLVETSPVPVMLYNIPSMTGIAVEPATIPRLENVGVQGTKDSSGIPANTLAYLAALGPDSDFRVVVGGEAFFLHLLDAGVCATTGLVPGVGPHLAARIYEAWDAGDHKAAFEAQHQANDLANMIRGFHSFAPATGKAILSRLGLMGKWVAPPKVSLTEEETDRAYATVRTHLPESESE